jgi:hypothetical protein
MKIETGLVPGEILSNIGKSQQLDGLHPFGKCLPILCPKPFNSFHRTPQQLR